MRAKKLHLVLVGCLGLALMTSCGKSSNPGEAMKERYAPYVDLGDYKAIQYTPTETEVTSEQVDQKVNQLITQNGKKIEKKAGVALQGDTVNIDYVGSVDGVEFAGGSTGGKGTEITLGSSGYVDNFDKQIEGHTPGDTFDVNVTFPENYGKEELNGKAAVFKTTLNYIVSTEYPELTDEFVAEKTEYKTVAEYRAAVEADLVKSQAEKDVQTDKDAMVEQLLETSVVKQYSEADIEDQTQRLIKQEESSASAYGIDMNQYLSAIGYDADKFQEEIRKGAEKVIKQRMIVCAIAEKEDISVTKAEADAKIQELLSTTGISDVAQLNSYTGYTDDDYYYMVLEEKVIDFIYNDAVPRDTGKGTSETVIEEGTSEAAGTEAASTEAPATEAGTEAASTEAPATEAASTAE